MHKKQPEKFCGQKNSEKCETHPVWAEKRRNRVRFGCWRGGCRCEWVRKPEIRTKMHHIAMQHMEKSKTGEKPSVFAGFVAGAEGLGLACRLGRAWTQPTGLQAPTTRTAGGPADAPRCQILLYANEKCQVPQKRYLTFLAGAEGLSLACRLGRFAAERHWRSLTPRHAVLEWMWEQHKGRGKGPVLAGSPRQVPKAWCWFGAAWKNPAAESVERPGKGLVHIVSHEIVRRAGRYVVERLYPLAVNGGRVWVSHARPEMHRIIPGVPLE